MGFSRTQAAAIKRFKKAETGAQTLFLQDKQVKKLCASWGFITRQISPDKKAAPKDENECWAWLWNAVKINIQELAYTTGGRDRVLSAFAIARANRLIYPDGSVNQFVLQILNPPVVKPVPLGTMGGEIKSSGGQSSYDPKGGIEHAPAKITKPLQL